MKANQDGGLGIRRLGGEAVRVAGMSAGARMTKSEPHQGVLRRDYRVGVARAKTPMVVSFSCRHLPSVSTSRKAAYAQVQEYGCPLRSVGDSVSLRSGRTGTQGVREGAPDDLEVQRKASAALRIHGA